jgi:capsular exopolysaccharide synthesis family protein
MKTHLKETKKMPAKPARHTTDTQGPDPELPQHMETDESQILSKPGTELMIRRMSDLVPLESDLREQQKIIEFHSDQQDVVQSFRSLRTLLLQQAGARNFSTLVTSVRSGDGASFVARNLATALAFDQTRTALLLDCNRMDPTLNGLLVADNSRGLTDLLDDPCDVSIGDIIYSTGIPRLRVIPVGNQRHSPVEYFTSQRMNAFLKVLSRRYSDRYIIVDSPAIQTSADARIIADWCDYIVVVARYGETTKQDLMDAIATLPKEKFAGVVFNDFDPVAAEPNPDRLRLSRQR